MHLLVEDLLLLFVELYGIHFQSLPVDFVRNFLVVAKLSFHVFLVLFPDLGDVRPLDYFLLPLLAQLLADLGEVQVQPCWILNLNKG